MGLAPDPDNLDRHATRDRPTAPADSADAVDRSLAAGKRDFSIGSDEEQRTADPGNLGC